IVLAAEARQVRVQVETGSLERLQQCHGRVMATRLAQAPVATEKARRRDQLEQLVAAGDDDAAEDDPGEEVHQAWAVASDPGLVEPCRAICRRFHIEPMNCLPSDRSRFASCGSLAIFFTDFQM